jgi:CheY-like chemotaxis protein
MVKILYVEDDSTFLKGMIDFLEFKKHDVKKAINGKHGLDILAQCEHIDLIFTDYFMPFMNGYDFSRTVKTDNNYSKYANIPIIGVGTFPLAKREYLVECVDKPDLQLTDMLKWIDIYCK